MILIKHKRSCENIIILLMKGKDFKTTRILNFLYLWMVLKLFIIQNIILIANRYNYLRFIQNTSKSLNNIIPQ